MIRQFRAQLFQYF